MQTDNVMFEQCSEFTNGAPHSTCDEAFVLCENQSGYVYQHEFPTGEVRRGRSRVKRDLDSKWMTDGRASQVGSTSEPLSQMFPSCRSVGMLDSLQVSDACSEKCVASGALHYSRSNVGKTTSAVAQGVPMLGGGQWATPVSRDPPVSMDVPVLTGVYKQTSHQAERRLVGETGSGSFYQ